jgi:anaphase-promoting complex subunit 10
MFLSLQLRDGNVNTYWQSDGPQPHCVNIHFPRTVSVCRIDVYTDLKVDESYTPAVISVRAGTFAQDLREVKQFQISEASGWISLVLTSPRGEPLKTCMLQVAVLANYQNGRDTHLRQVRVYAPQPDAYLIAHPFPPSTVEFSSFSVIR